MNHNHFHLDANRFLWKPSILFPKILSDGKPKFSTPNLGNFSPSYKGKNVIMVI